jgi:hypothetical protein
MDSPIDMPEWVAGVCAVVDAAGPNPPATFTDGSEVTWIALAGRVTATTTQLLVCVSFEPMVIPPQRAERWYARTGDGSRIAGEVIAGFLTGGGVA